MIDLKDFRRNPDVYRAGAELKGARVDFDSILALDAKCRAAAGEYESARAEQNAASKLIGSLRDDQEKRAAIERVGGLKARVKEAEERLKTLAADLHSLLLRVPQPPDPDVPRGSSSADNVVVRAWGTPPGFPFKPKSHVELGNSLGILDIDGGVRVAGSRSFVLKGAGAMLHQAVLRLANDMMVTEHGFMPLTVPVLVREEALEGTGFFPGGREQTYRVPEDELYLAGTAEVGITASCADRIFEEADLPLKYVAVSACFRREAGTYGKDTAGLYRVHQFEKCEQVVICRADIDESRRWHERMLGFSEDFLRRLELPYRVVHCCTGDIGVKNAAQFDIETWMPSRFQSGTPESGYGETHSASRLYQFQARRLNIRYRDAAGELRHCHTLNNTVAASPRILIPLLENHQDENGRVRVPAALRKYMNGLELIGA